LALFGREGKKGSGDDGAEAVAEAEGIVSAPEKAKPFFEHARTVHDSTNYEYAMTLWLQGLAKDPFDVEATESFYRTGCDFAARQSKGKGPTKEQLKALPGKGPVSKYLESLLQFGARPLEWPYGLRAVEQAAKLGLEAPAVRLGRKVLGLALEDPRAKKDQYASLMRALAEVGAYDEAARAGEAAIALDRTDANLEAEVRNMSAQAAMTRGGFEQTGEQGGFRKNVRNIEAQRAKEEEERLVKSESTVEAVLQRAKEDYESRPTDAAAIRKYGKALTERGKPEDEKEAYRLYMKAYEDTDSFEFRRLAGDVQMRVARRKLRLLRDEAKANPGDETLQKKFAAAARQVLEKEAEEYEARVEASPTDLQMRFQLGRRHLELGNYERAIEQFQQSKDSPGLADQSRLGLASAFAKLGWVDEAEATYRDALAEHENPNNDLGLELRYGLMSTLAKISLALPPRASSAKKARRRARRSWSWSRMSISRMS